MAAIQSYPWLWPYGGDSALFDVGQVGEGVVSGFLNARRHLSSTHLPFFVPSSETLGALDYERCVDTGQIPTRDLSHDWYNGQVWLRFPQAKRCINARHLADVCQRDGGEFVGSGNGRSRLRDALTLFDESGALLLTTEPRLSAALLSHDWPSLLTVERASWSQRARLLILGHGLLDSLHNPHKGLCAKAIPVCVPSLRLVDDELQRLVVKVVEQIQMPANFSPLPVMGVPGWFIESEVPGFYSDTDVYRAKPTRRSASCHERLAFDWDGSTLALGKCAGQSLPEFQGEESPDSSEHGAG